MEETRPRSPAPRTQPIRGGLARVARLRAQGPAGRTTSGPGRADPVSPGGRGGGGGTPSAATRGPRPQCPAPPRGAARAATVSARLAPRAPARPTCASAQPGPGPGLRQPDAAAAAGPTRSPRLRRTRSSALGGGAQRSPRNPFVWLNRCDITRRPNRRLPGGGAAEPACVGAPCRRSRALRREVDVVGRRAC